MTSEQQKAWRQLLERAFEVEAGSPITIQDELGWLSALGPERLFEEFVDADDDDCEEEER